LDSRAARIWQAVQGEDRQLGCTRPSRSRDWTGEACFTPRGKVLGGSSSINSLLYVRGQTRLTIAGGQHWQMAGVRRCPALFSRKAKTKQRARDDFHGRGPVAGFPDWVIRFPLSAAFITAAAETGLGASNPELNGASRKAGFFQTTTRYGRRASAGGRLSSPRQGPQQTCVSRPPRWRSASCSMAGVAGGGRIPPGRAALKAARGAPAGRFSGDLARRSNSPQLLQLSGVGPGGFVGALDTGRARNRAGAPGVGHPICTGSHAGSGVMRCSQRITLTISSNHPVRKILMGCDMRHSGLDR